MNIAILTGASSGLGVEYAKAIVKHRPDIDVIWLIARRKEALDRLAASLPEGKCRPMPLDLTDPLSYAQLERILREENPTVKLLVNNAGCGRLGNVIEEHYTDQIRQTNLNVTALTAVTNIALKHMPTEAEKGMLPPAIIQICSIASFCPNPRMTVYSSTKAYVLSYTKGLAFELRKTAIRVLAVCPGPMRTEFLDVAGIEKGSSKTFDTLPYTDPVRVAKASLLISSRRSGIYTPRAFFKFYRVLAKLTPHGLMMHASKT